MTTQAPGGLEAALNKKSETARIFHSIDWSQHPLGPVPAWPVALKIALGIIFNSQHPMCIGWGHELYQFYNDGYLPGLGAGRHPQAMGQRGMECWREKGPSLKPQIDRVMNEGESARLENQLISTFKNGYPEDAYWTYEVSPIFDDDNSIGGVLVVCAETKEPIKAPQLIDQVPDLQQQNEIELTESHAALASVLEGMNDAFCILDADWNYVRVNKHYERVVGKAREELIGKNIWKLFPDVVGTRTYQEYQRVMRARVSSTFESHYDGFDRWTTGNVFPTHQGGIAAFLRDTTAQKKAEMRAEESKRNLQLALERGHMGIWQLDLKTNNVFFSPEAMALFLIDSQEVNVPELINSMMHPEDVDEINRVLLGAIGNRKPYLHEYRIIRTDGQVRWLRAQGDVVLDEEGNAIYYSGAVQDITERKNSESALREAQEKLSFALESAKMGTWHIDLKTDVVTTSTSAAKLFGINYINENVFDLISRQIHPDDQKAANTAWREAVANRSRYYQEYRIIRPDGEVLWMFSEGTTKVDSNGEAVAISGVLGDINDRVLVRLELEKAKLEAELANDAKTSFMANMSHEIRTPIGVIIGFCELLQEEDLTADERKEYLTRAVKNAKGLTRIIDDILDLTKVEAGRLEIEEIEFSLRDLLYEVVDFFSDRAKDKDISLQLVFKNALPKTIFSDPTRLRQILVNIIGNAIKFTSIGGVTVLVSSNLDKGGRQKFEIRVVDSGIGISDAQKELIFQPFVQAESSTNRIFGGTGLGLVISRRLAVALGGNISVESVEGQGCTFTISFHTAEKAKDPLSERESGSPPATSPVARAAVAHRLSGITVLLAEDSADNQQLIKRILIKNGAVVELAGDGEEAIQKALKGNFDVILMDVQMPRVDGYEATRSLRKSGFENPIIALTAHAMTEEKKKSNSAGCNAHLTKPINTLELIETITHLVQL